MDDEDDFEDPGETDPVLKDVLNNRSPPRQRVHELARALVDRAQLRFKNFREDRERIENAAVQASSEGHIHPKDARDIFMDKADCVSGPLLQRYLDAREFELAAKYLKYRIMYHPTDWLTPRNRMALDGMIAGGETGLAIDLLREYLKKLRNSTQEAWRAAGRKMRPDLPIEMRGQFETMKAEALRVLPGKLEIAELEMAEIETYFGEHGSREDNRLLEKFRDEIAKARKRFDIA